MSNLEFTVPRLKLTDTAHGDDTPWRGNCVAHATTNINIATTIAGSTIDTVLLAAGDRLLVSGQTTATENGIYTIGAATTVRATDMPVGERVGGVQVRVERGTDPFSTWVCITPDAIVGTDNLVFDRAYSYTSSAVGNVKFGDGTNNTQTLIPFDMASDHEISVDAGTSIPGITAIKLNNTAGGNTAFSIGNSGITYLQTRAASINIWQHTIGTVNWSTLSTAAIYALGYQNGGTAFPIFINTSGAAVIQVQLATSTSNVNVTTGNVGINGIVTFGSYGSGTQTGTAAYELKVNASGVVKENIREYISVHNGTLLQIFSGAGSTIVSFSTVQSSSPACSLAASTITIIKTGTFRVTYDISLRNSSGATPASVRYIIFRGAGGIRGTYAFTSHQVSSTGYQTASCTTILPVTSGDTYTVRAQILSGTSLSSLSYGCRFTFEEI